MRWTPEQRSVLLQWAGIRPVSAIAGMIGRSVPSVRAEASRMRLSGIDVPTLRDWWLCPVCGSRNPVSSDRCELCYRRELAKVAARRRELADSIEATMSRDEVAEIVRTIRATKADNRAVGRKYKAVGMSPRANPRGVQSETPFTESERD